MGRKFVRILARCQTEWEARNALEYGESTLPRGESATLVPDGDMWTVIQWRDEEDESENAETARLKKKIKKLKKKLKKLKGLKK